MEIMSTFDWTRFSVISEHHVDQIWKLTRDAMMEIGEQKNMTLAAIHTYGLEGDTSLSKIMKNVADVSRSKIYII